MLSMVSFFPNIEFLTMKYSPPTQIQPHHDLMAKHLNPYQCITAKIHSSINTMSKYTLINTCTLRSVTRHKSFAGNMLSLKFECGPLCRKLALCQQHRQNMMILQIVRNIILLSIKNTIPNEDFSPISEPFKQKLQNICMKRTSSNFVSNQGVKCCPRFFRIYLFI